MKKQKRLAEGLSASAGPWIPEAAWDRPDAKRSDDEKQGQ